LKRAFGRPSVTQEISHWAESAAFLRSAGIRAPFVFLPSLGRGIAEPAAVKGNSFALNGHVDVGGRLLARRRLRTVEERQAQIAPGQMIHCKREERIASFMRARSIPETEKGVINDVKNWIVKCLLVAFNNAIL
jgi:hypothetical protein